MPAEVGRAHMIGFTYRNSTLHCEGVSVADAAKALGTPLFLYSQGAIVEGYREIRDAFAAADPLICYSVKANANLNIIRRLAREGAGFDVVSGGELFRVLRAGGDPRKIVFAGVGKRADEIRMALDRGIFCLNAESAGELENIAAIAAELRVMARVALRFNPDVDAGAHAHISTGKSENKFGLDAAVVRELFAGYRRHKNVNMAGIHVHIGSQITATEPHRLALDRALKLIAELERDGARIEHLNLGGGFGVSYDGGKTPSAADFAEKLLPPLAAAKRKLILEPGRYVVGNAGILVTRVVYVKRASAGKLFIICDAGMNDLIRPAFYDAMHHVWPVSGSTAPILGGSAPMEPQIADVVGPICESGDFIAKNRPLPPLKPGDLLAIFGSGAYGMSMSSNYNARPRACEAWAEGDELKVIRAREKYEDLVRGEENTIPL